MKRTFHVWNRELKIVTQIILNTSFWENFTENGRSQIFTFFEKKMTFYHCTLCADIFRAGGLFFIHCTAVKHPYSISSYFFKPKEDCLWRLYERRLSFVYPCVSLMFFCICTCCELQLKLPGVALWPAKWLTRKCFPFILVS